MHMCMHVYCIDAHGDLNPRTGRIGASSTSLKPLDHDTR